MQQTDAKDSADEAKHDVAGAGTTGQEAEETKQDATGVGHPNLELHERESRDGDSADEEASLEGRLAHLRARREFRRNGRSEK